MAVEALATLSSNTYVRSVQWGVNGGSSSGVKWSSPDLTYSYSGSWASFERASIENAFDLFASVSNLTFTETAGASDLTLNKFHNPFTGLLERDRFRRKRSRRLRRRRRIGLAGSGR